MITTLNDRTEITDLVYRLGACLDEGRFDDMHELLAEQATASTPGGQVEGREAVIAQAQRNHTADERYQHLITNLLLDLDGDRAKVRANSLVVIITSPGPVPGETSAPPELYTIGGVYHFEFARTTDGWRFSRIEVDPGWVSSAVPTPAPVA